MQYTTATAGLLRVTAFETRYNDLIVSALQPSGMFLAENVNKAKVQGIEASWRATVYGTDLGASVTFQNPVDEQNNTQLLRRARRHAALDVGRNFGNWRFGGEWLVSSSRMDAGSRRLGGYGIVNLNARYNIDKQWFVAARVENLFDKDYQLAYPYNTQGRAMSEFRRALALWLALALASAVVFVASLALGSVSLDARELWQALAGADTGTAGAIVRELRLPRAAAAFACGGLLALSGALMQVLLRNPLAEPYVLGVSGGASVGALLAMLALAPWWGVQTAAAVGALCSMLLVATLARRDLLHPQVQGGHREAGARLLLTGVILAAGWGAVITLILAVAPESRLRGMLFWLTGDLGGTASYGGALATMIVALLLAMPMARALNVMLLGETVAQSLGVRVGRVRLLTFLLSSVCIAVAITTAGSIGFVGLVVPHLVRLAWGNDQRLLLPAAVLLGGALLMAADLIARTVIAPAQLPVGVITALLGVPTFLYLLLRRPR
ncbi:Vitamin B12 import system permease protein BtuC [compost metagenome]